MKGGVAKGPILGFAAPEAESLPDAPEYSGLVRIPNIPANTLVKVRAEIKVTKPDPKGGNLPPLPVSEEVTSVGSKVPVIEDQPVRAK